MLDLLIDYAKTHGLTVEPGFKPKTIRWAIVCHSDGHFLNVQELGNPNDKFNPGQRFDVCPDLSQPEMKAGGPGCRHFLVDNVEVVTLMGKKGDLRSDDGLNGDLKDVLKGAKQPWRIVKRLSDLTEGLKKQLRSKRKGSREEGILREKIKMAEEFKKPFEKHEFFRSLLVQCSTAVKETGLLAKMLESQEFFSKIQHAFADQPFRPSDRVTFAITGRTPMFLVEDNVWHNWWRTFRQSLVAKKTEKKRAANVDSSAYADRMRCFGSGELVVPKQTHDKIEGLANVGGIAMGDALVSFKQESFQSYFLPQATNAAVSEDMAAAYRAGLNDIIKKHSQILAGAKVVHWYVGPTEVTKEEDPMSFLDESADETEKERDAFHRAREFLKALESGTKPRLKELKKYRFYAMIVSANSGRVVARDWIEGHFGDLAKSVVKWYEHLEIMNINGNRSANSPTIERVITSMLPPRGRTQKYKDWIKPIGEERSQLWHAAISEEVSLPHKVVSRLVPLHQAFMLSGDFQNTLDEQSRDRPRNLSMLYSRMGLLKAYHIRKGDKNMQPYLNDDHPSPAYHCGRLMAVLAEIQRTALPNVGAGVIQRYYAAASTTPALVLGRLVKTSNFHLDKIDYRKKRTGLTDVLTGIWGQLKDNVPRVLDLEEQSYFALGFYQQFGRLGSTDWSKYQNQFTTTKEEGEES
jgi:CRISPR-associated protein Csd1